MKDCDCGRRRVLDRGTSVTSSGHCRQKLVDGASSDGCLPRFEVHNHVRDTSNSTQGCFNGSSAVTTHHPSDLKHRHCHGQPEDYRVGLAGAGCLFDAAVAGGDKSSAAILVMWLGGYK